MRIVDDDHMEEVVNDSVTEAVKGGVVGGLIGGIFYAGANRFWPAYQRLTKPLKVYSIAIPVITGMMILGEGRLLEIEAEQHKQHEKKARDARIERYHRLEQEAAMAKANTQQS